MTAILGRKKQRGIRIEVATDFVVRGREWFGTVPALPLCGPVVIGGEDIASGWDSGQLSFSIYAVELVRCAEPRERSGYDVFDCSEERRRATEGCAL